MKYSNRQRIVNSAVQLFNTYGYKCVTVEDVAKRIGISKKTIYKHFDSKECLAQAVLEEFMNKINSKEERTILSEGLSPYVRIRQYIVQLKEDISLISPIFLEDIKKFLPELWQNFHERQKEKVYALDSIIKEGQQTGLIKNIRPELIIQIILSAVSVVAQPEFIIENGFTQEEVFDAISDIFIDGLLKTRPNNI